jgi:hypothetical protein
VTRQRNSRRLLLTYLRDAKRRVGYVIHDWDANGKVYVDLADRADPSAWWRPRQPHEYPESNPDAWARVEREMDWLAQYATEIKGFAREQREALTIGAGQ